MTSRHDTCRSRLFARAAGDINCAAACLAISGCGNGLAKVSGQVTLDGQPLHGGKGDIA